MSTTSSSNGDHNDSLLIDVEEAGRILSLRPKTVYELAGRGVIPSIKVGRLRRFRRRELEEWVDAQTSDTAT